MLRGFFLGTAAISAALCSLPVSAAVVVTAGGVDGGSAGVISEFQGDPGYVTVDFDGLDTSGPGPTIQGPLTLTGDYRVSPVSQTDVRAAPAGDTTAYVSVPYSQSSGSASVDLTLAPGHTLNYLGLYWGSIDTYNSLQFFLDETLIEEISGAEVLEQLSLSGNQTSPGSNRYINLFLTDGSLFNRFVANSNGFAFEFDNVTVGLAEVPEPATVGLLGLGMLGVAARRRRRAQGA